MKRLFLQKSIGLFAVIVILLVGFFVLAVMDESYRPAFADLAKVGIGGYLAMLIPTSNS
ncbi:MAG TPA: hypothetical protein V6D50_09225 [Chroococcales cyanobacterium]|jgi:hypothetical protein